MTSVLIEMAGGTRPKTDISGQHSRFNLMQPLSNLIDLPMEVLFEILLLLEWKDILRIRQTCQLLRDVSLARPVWLSLVRWYSATVRPRLFFPEKPLKLYTDRELERLVLRWQSGRKGCTPPKQRDITISEVFVQRPYYLVEGGRWFLFGSDGGSIKYLDLDVPTETSEPVTLIPTCFKNPDAMMISVDMDLGAEYLTFNLGIVTYRQPGPRGDLNNPIYASWIRIYRVTSDWDENGQVKGLRAEQLACLPGKHWFARDAFTLRGRYVAYSIYSYAPGASIAIVDWTLADPTSLNYLRRIFCNPVWWMELLPDDRLICQDSSGILLFDFNDAAVTTIPATQPNQPPTQPPVASLRMNTRAISRPYVLPDSIRFSALTGKGVHGIIIPSSPGVSHTMNCLDLCSDSKHIPYAYLNYDRAILCGCPDRTILQYVWPDEDSSSLMPPKTVVETPFHDISFDSSTSRIVTISQWSKISIIDLASV